MLVSLILLNRRALPEGVRIITSYRLVVMGISFSSVGFFSVGLIYSVIKDNVFGG